MKGTTSSMTTNVAEGVSIITVSNKPDCIDNILENFLSQDYFPKELILILNNNQMDFNQYENKTKVCQNLRIYQLDEKISLGTCLNLGVTHAKYDIVAKFDDDDYYSSDYLVHSVDALSKSKVKVVGKSAIYIYFEESKTLAIKNPSKENTNVYRVSGGTLVFKKDIFNKIQFPDLSFGEDFNFCLECSKHGIPIFSHSVNDYVYIRHALKEDHTWRIPDAKLMEICTPIGIVTNVKEFISNHNL